MDEEALISFLPINQLFPLPKTLKKFLFFWFQYQAEFN